MTSFLHNFLAQDLDYIVDYGHECFRSLKGSRIFLTGGTGFFGCWLLESLLWANNKLNLDTKVMTLTRDPERFQTAAPHLATNPAVELLLGDIRNFNFPKGAFDFVVHAATASSKALNDHQPEEMFDTIAKGTEHTLAFAQQASCQGFLLTSSGAIYGRQPSDIHHLSEEFLGGPDPLNPVSAYGEGKRTAELLAVLAHKRSGLKVKIARGFAFVGPYLPLDIHFAIGNFIRDGLNGGPIKIKGDGTPHRSYLYASDLVIWLWTILLEGQVARPYNVGSEDSLSIREIAQAVSKAFSPSPIIEVAHPANPMQPVSRYVPSTQRAREELNLTQTVPLDLAIAKTIIWNRQVRP